MISILKIEIDGHFHGGEPVKPWVAEITGPHPKYGLARRFLDPMNDWSQAKRAMSGNIYGRVAHFALREGRLYEVSRCRGNPSKRHVVREFVEVRDGKREKLSPEEALARIDGDGSDSGVALKLKVPDETSGRSWVARVSGLGTPDKLGFVVIDGERLYRLRVGALFEVVDCGRQRFARADVDGLVWMSEGEALQWLFPSARSA